MTLTDSEVKYIEGILGREMNELEEGMLDVMFSEHCSYKSSRPILKLFPTEGENIVLGPGDDAGLVSITDEYALAVGMESHNHPSAIEPYGGAGTGIGGILRDIISMGAMPIALLDSLRFGPLEDQKSRYLFEHVVEGISDYGNRVGVPTVAGEIEFDESFSKMEREFQLAEDGTGTTGRAFILANSVWVNNAYRVFMKDEYKKYTERVFGASAEEEDKGYITEAINNWFTVKTHGFMEEMGTDFSNSCTVFADVLYVKACWKDRFYDHEIENGVFNTINRDEVQKQFMCRKEEFLYYEGEDGKAIIVPLEGGLLFVAALGKRIDIDKHIKNKDFSDEVVILRIPKMNIDTSVDNSAIMEFLKSRGATDVFDRQKADFSPMKEESSDPVYIDSIVQRAKLNMDEYGIEASAGEVMLAAVSAGGYIPREPKEFIADKPFSFALYYNTYMDEEPKMLYYGRYVE